MSAWVRIAVLGAAWLLPACEFVNVGQLVEGGLRAGAMQLPVGPEEEIAYGGAVSVQVVARYGGLDKTPELVEYVNLVGEALAIHSPRPELPYHFAILNTDEVNAVSAPGGYVFITRGALKACRSEAELAGILAHEIAHIAAGHATKILQNLKSKQALVDSTGWKSQAVFGQIVDGFLDDYMTKGLPQDDEFEADRIGTAILARVGWAPDGLRSVLSRLAAGRTAESNYRFYGTHPDTGARVSRIDALLPGYKDKDGVTLELRFRDRTAILSKRVGHVH